MPIFNCGLNDVDTTDATAVASDILENKTAYAFGEKLTGTMPYRGQIVHDLSTVSDVASIPYGYYNTSSIEIAASEKLKLIPDNIKEDVTILGVTGTFSGGGGILLNIEQYTSGFPATANENTVGIVSNEHVAINGYVISATQPSNPANGLVWIKENTLSPAPLSITRDGNVIIYPIAVKQYYDGTWEHSGFESKIYVGGTWKQLRKYLVTNGVRNVEWSRESSTRVKWAEDTGNNYITFGNTGGTVDTAMCTSERLDLVGWKTIYIDWKGSFANRGYFYVGANSVPADTNTTQPNVTSAQFRPGTAQSIYSADISGIASTTAENCSIKFYYDAGTNGNAAYIYNIWLEG